MFCACGLGVGMKWTIEETWQQLLWPHRQQLLVFSFPSGILFYIRKNNPSFLQNNSLQTDTFKRHLQDKGNTFGVWLDSNWAVSVSECLKKTCIKRLQTDEFNAWEKKGRWLLVLWVLALSTLQSLLWNAVLLCVSAALTSLKVSWNRSKDRSHQYECPGRHS